MSQVLGLTTGTLPASKTNKAGRRWAFLPSSDPTAVSLGTLTVVNSKADTASYGLAVEGGEYLFARTTGTAEVYAVSCDRTGRPCRCTCDGFRFGQRKGIVCKHISAVVELQADGVLDCLTRAPTAHPDADLAGGF